MWELYAGPPLDQVVCSPFNIIKLKFGDIYARYFYFREGDHTRESKGCIWFRKFIKKRSKLSCSGISAFLVR